MNDPVIFLDKDGTLVKDVPYNVDPSKVVLAEGAATGLRKLAEENFRFVVVTNQSGIARGYFEEKALDGIVDCLREKLRNEAGATLEGFYYCPHHPDGALPDYAFACDCRKPEPGLLFRAARELDIQLNEAWMVGDILDDIEAGKRAGCRTILIDNGNETEWKNGPEREPDFRVGNLEEAAQIILAAYR